MSWLLAGCCGLALINLSVTLQLAQRPRFFGVRAGGRVGIYCMSLVGQLTGNVTWYKNKTMEIDGSMAKRITFDDPRRAFLYISDLRIEDSGVYYCKRENDWGPGTKVQVVHKVIRDKAEYRSKMKDGLIVLQGLLLAVCIAAVVMRKQKLLEKRDSIYEEPETDHIYEGLAIETCGGGLYEELTVYAQADGAEAPWE
ncbi:B-cell antigen receptor complex-associated protein beta chain [Channa argus]|uniref:B-cell antigen receptor complex-associated protein beta chain n=1 Tax=Channa argus TaxID=215402 RepID=UPI0029484C41|nr:hypothetical protein Q8A73_021001 [Channa argus]